MKRLSKEKRRQQLLEVASELFIEKGYYETTTKEIAKSAGVSEPVIYQHFTSKHELFFEVMYKIVSEAFTRMEIDTDTDLKVFLNSFIKLHLENVIKHFKSLKFLFIQILQDDKVKEYYLSTFVPKMVKLILPQLKKNANKLNNYSIEFNAMILGGMLFIFEVAKGLFDFTPENLSLEELSNRLTEIFIKIITDDEEVGS
ncbi:MAG: hypothetical protein PWP71_1761 [Clostridia bacterium]|jgi:AcrR family transcriptional regulator|nr:hypothetical protein [Clostridia bacterium]